MQSCTRWPSVVSCTSALVLDLTPQLYICALGHISTDVESEVHIGGLTINDHQANYGTRKTNRSDSHPFESKFLRFGGLTQKLWFGCFL